MAFRKYGGMQYSGTNNYSNSRMNGPTTLAVNGKSGETNTKITFDSHIDSNNNSLINVGSIVFSDGSIQNSSTSQGSTGEPGPQGPQGPPGPKGDPGKDGATGPKGNTGPQGPQGDKGAMGTAGTNGTDGTNGAQGPQGDPISISGNIIADYVYSVANYLLNISSNNGNGGYGVYISDPSGIFLDSTINTDSSLLINVGNIDNNNYTSTNLISNNYTLSCNGCYFVSNVDLTYGYTFYCPQFFNSTNTNTGLLDVFNSSYYCTGYIFYNNSTPGYNITTYSGTAISIASINITGGYINIASNTYYTNATIKLSY